MKFDPNGWTSTHDITPDVSFVTFQAFIERCYKGVNGRNYSNVQLASKIQRYATIATKAVRKEKISDVGPNLAMCMAWVAAFANRIDIELDAIGGGEIWKRFPGVCPYCGTTPCTCKERRAKRLTAQEDAVVAEQPGFLNSIRSYQEMFQDMYPGNERVASCLHLLEEISELEDAVQTHSSTHEEKVFDNIVEELVDVVANLFAVAWTNEIDLGLEIASIFENDVCPGCRYPVCHCGYTVTEPARPKSAPPQAT